MLATLGYGDAIGHEVLGIQRVLRAAGYESDIFVETADPGSRSMTRDYRELVDASDPDNMLLHHFSIGSQGVADGVRAARSDGAHLPQHHAARIFRRRPPHARAASASAAAGSCAPTSIAATWRSATRNSTARSSRRSASRAPRVLPVVPGFSHLDREPNWLVARDFDDDWTNILFVGRVIPNKRIEDVIRFFHAYHTRLQPAIAAAARRRARRVRALPRVAAPTGCDASAPRMCISSATSRTRNWSAYYEVADLFLCASEHEGFCVPLVEAFYKQMPVIAYAATAVPATMDGAGVLFDDQGSARKSPR